MIFFTARQKPELKIGANCNWRSCFTEVRVTEAATIKLGAKKSLSSTQVCAVLFVGGRTVCTIWVRAKLF